MSGELREGEMQCLWLCVVDVFVLAALQCTFMRFKADFLPKSHEKEVANGTTFFKLYCRKRDWEKGGIKENGKDGWEDGDMLAEGKLHNGELGSGECEGEDDSTNFGTNQWSERTGS